jgi:hypothetical protein
MYEPCVNDQYLFFFGMASEVTVPVIQNRHGKYFEGCQQTDVYVPVRVQTLLFIYFAEILFQYEVNYVAKNSSLYCHVRPGDGFECFALWGLFIHYFILTLD